MKRSQLRTAAISWVIAGGLLFCGTTPLATASPAPDPGTIHSGDASSGRPKPHSGNPARPDANPATPANRQPASASATVPDHRGRLAPPDPRRAASANSAAIPDPLPWPFPFPWPFPWPWPCGCNGDALGVGAPIGATSQTPPPQSGGTDYSPPPLGGGPNLGGVRGYPPLSPPGPSTQPGEPSVIDAERGIISSTGSDPAPILFPPLMGGPATVGGASAVEAPIRAPSTGSAAASGSGTRDIARSGEGTIGRERLPGGPGSGPSQVPESFRLGYPEYLREAKVGEVAVFALPGVLGILALTALGGFLGYRQAKAGHAVRAAGTARFLR